MLVMFHIATERLAGSGTTGTEVIRTSLTRGTAFTFPLATASGAIPFLQFIARRSGLVFTAFAALVGEITPLSRTSVTETGLIIVETPVSFAELTVAEFSVPKFFITELAVSPLSVTPVESLPAVAPMPAVVIAVIRSAVAESAGLSGSPFSLSAGEPFVMVIFLFPQPATVATE